MGRAIALVKSAISLVSFLLLMANIVGSRSTHNFIGGLHLKLSINEKGIPKVGERQICEKANYANLRRCCTQSCTIEKALIYI